MAVFREDLMIFFKCGVYVLSAVLLVLMGYVMALGQGLRKARKANEVDIFNDVTHEYCGKLCFKITFVIVLFVEGALFALYGFHPRPHLPGFTKHLWGGAIPFITLISICAYWITGRSRLQRWHRWVAYPCIAWAIPMVISGNILVYNL